jgi:hypothetical protein
MNTINITNNEKEVLLQYLKESQPFEYKGFQRYSTLVAGLKDCRANTKRNAITGIFDNNLNGHPGNWLGTIGYFTILDQIGSCFKLKENTRTTKSTNSIKLAIESFGYNLIDNDSKKLNALIALRNSFTHDFNLLNIPKDKELSQTHKFTVTANIYDNWIVKLPGRQWDGNIEAKNFDDTSNTTYVNLFGLGQLVEEIYSKICELIENDKIDLKMNFITLINKYTFTIS